MNGGQKKHLLKQWRDLSMRLMPVVETADGEVYFQLNDNLEWEYGGACNTGLLVEGRMPYDDTKSLDENLYDITEYIKEKYD